MTRAPFICPACGAKIIIADASSGVLTCPRCLSEIDIDAMDRSANPVIPLEYEAKIDLAGSGVLLACLAACIVVGVALLLVSDAGTRFGGQFVLGIVALTLVYYVLRVMSKRQLVPVIRPSNSLPEADQPPLDVPILDYSGKSRPHKVRRPKSPADEALRIIKFFGGLVGGLFLMGLLVRWNISVMWVEAAGIVCLFFRGWRSVGAGIIVALPLGALLFLCFCFMAIKKI